MQNWKETLKYYFQEHTDEHFDIVVETTRINGVLHILS